MRNGLGLRTRLLTTRRTILRQYSITHLWTERKCVVHWYAHDHHLVDTVLHVVVMMGQQDPTLPPHTRGPPLHQKIAPFHTIASALVPHPLLLRGPTSSIAGWRCSECKHCCGSSHCDHTNHRNSAAHSWQQHRNSHTLPVEVFHVWCAAPSNQRSRQTPPQWRKTDASQRFVHPRLNPAHPAGIRPTSKVDCCAVIITTSGFPGPAPFATR